MTSKIWIQLPVRGNLGLIFPPRKPSSQSITSITMIVHNMRFLLLGDLPCMMVMEGGLSNPHLLPGLDMIDGRPALRLNLSYNKHSPVTSIDRGVFVSATWGRLNQKRNTSQ